MKASEVRNKMNRVKANHYILNAANAEEDNVDIPKHLVDRKYLQSEGYTVGAAHQMSDSVNVSWKEVEDRRGG